ncbi:GNAT family N-acetyltransferase [Streptomyces sp. NPDC086023]|uniref:GNAT family N-acetyltransferase n=1 Tax=Streptomyces sp. NPDC086023 TaxID=3365746 RepID=UPI0037D0A7C7
MDMVTLTTARLVLRPHTPEDTAEMHAACHDPEIRRWMTIPDPYPMEAAARFVEETVPAGWKDGSQYNFVAREADGGPLVAALCVHRLDDHIHEIGYWAAPGHRGKGYTTEAVRAAAHWAFTEAGVVRLVWRAGVGNDASRAIAEKAGFVMEGVQRSGMEHDGVLRDCWAAALLPSDLGLPSALPHESETAAGA